MLGQILAVLLATMVVTNVAGNASAKSYEEPKQTGIKYVRSMIEIGDSEYAVKDYKDALKAYDKALSVYEHPRIYKKIALCLNAMGNKKEAMMVYQYANELAVKLAGKR